MDVVGLVSSVIDMTSSISKWAEQVSKRNETIENLAATVNRLSSILEVLRSKASSNELHNIVTLEILALGSLLKKTQEHIEVWSRPSPKRKFMAVARPSYVLAKFQDDERRMALQVIELLFALSTCDVADTGLQHMHKWIRNQEVSQFWMKEIGTQVFQPK